MTEDAKTTDTAMVVEEGYTTDTAGEEGETTDTADESYGLNFAL